MNARGRGLLLAVVHVAILGSVGAKLLADRITLPRVWARTAPVDPSLPIRGRYVRLILEVVPRGFEPGPRGALLGRARLDVEGGRLVARPAPDGERGVEVRVGLSDSTVVEIVEPVAFFIPEHVPDPAVRRAGERLWAQVSLPRSGPPRPIRLGIGDDRQVRAPLDLR